MTFVFGEMLTGFGCECYLEGLNRKHFCAFQQTLSAVLFCEILELCGL